MGTSRSVPPSPKWASVKTAVTTALNDGPITPPIAQDLMSQFVQQICDQGGEEGFGILPTGFGNVSPKDATQRLEKLISSHPVSTSRASSGGGGGGGGSSGGGASRKTTGSRTGGGRRGGGKARSIKGTGIRPTALRVASFLSDVKKVGLVQALAERGIADAASLPPDKLALAIADVLQENSNHIIETELRDALSQVFERICEEQASIEDVEAALDVAAGDICTVITQLFECYIVERFKTIHGEHLSAKHGFEAADKIVDGARHYVASELALEKANRRDLTEVDWAGTEGKQIVEAILERTVSVYIDTEDES